MAALLKDCHTEAEIVAIYRAARDRLWNPPSLRIIASPPDRPGGGGDMPPRRPVDHNPDDPPLSVDDIIVIKRAVAAFFRIRVAALASPDRRSRMILPRFIAIHLARVMTHASSPEIGRAFKRDHSTIIYALRKVDDWIVRDPDFAQRVARVRERVMRFYEQQPRERANGEHSR